MSIERNKAGTTKRSPHGLSYPNQNIIIINKILYFIIIIILVIFFFYKIWKKYNEIQLPKNKMDLNNRKMTNHPLSPEWMRINVSFIHGNNNNLLSRIS